MSPKGCINPGGNGEEVAVFASCAVVRLPIQIDEAQQEKSVSALAFTFTKLVVADLERAMAFYRDAIGLHLIGHASTDEHVEAIMAIPGSQGGPLLMLMYYLDSPALRAGSACVGFAVIPTRADADSRWGFPSC